MRPGEEELQRAVHALGHCDLRWREAARAAIIAEGASGLSVLVRCIAEEQARRKPLRYVQGAFFALYAASCVLAIAGHLQPGIIIAPLLFLGASCALITPSWYPRAVLLLGDIEDLNALPPMIEAIPFVDGHTLSELNRLLTARLSELKSGRTGWLQGPSRKILLDLMRLSESLYYSVLDAEKEQRYAALFRFAAEAGMTEALPALWKTVEYSARNLHQKRLRAAAEEAIDRLEGIVQSRKPGERLLRPAGDRPDELLRPAEAAPETDPTQLLRPALSSVGESSEDGSLPV